MDRFELIAELASGGMATVYLARLSGVAGFQRLVAIKKLHPHLAKEPDFIQMFLDEARLAARLHHPHVVPILEIGEGEDGYFLVMEYIEGDTLARLLARSAQNGKPIPPKAAIRMALDLLSGLHAAHELTDDEGRPLNIVHRDVSPQNVLCGVDGSVRLTDFGVARAASRLTTTRTGQLKGKLSYMAPEQARGKDLDRRADLFAAGIVIWESLAMRRLFKGNGDAETLDRVLYEPIPTLRDANPDMPESISAVCMTALEREVDKRHETAAKFADVLEEAAREGGLLGTHRDVAQHLELVLGRNITSHRDQVRSWLAHSEPSRPSTPRRESRPFAPPPSVSSGGLPTAGPGETTVAEQAPRSNQAAMAKSGETLQVIDRASTWSTPPSDSPPAPVDSLTPPPAMSSITGVSPTGGGASTSVVTAPSSAKPSRRWIWAVSGGAVMLLVGVLAFRIGASRGASGSQSVSGGPAASSTEGGEGRAAAADNKTAAPASAPSPSESSDADDSSAKVRAAGALGVPGAHSGAGKFGRGSPKAPRLGASGAPSSSAPALPDDIEHNPYR